ncbi:MAG: hypothetical protein HYV63_04405 [Candidatus Schekmanbacteria bacterium]|nr:hypothetical protein [Candidatus Schekmanbacteria bacterium]
MTDIQSFKGGGFLSPPGSERLEHRPVVVESPDLPSDSERAADAEYSDASQDHVETMRKLVSPAPSPVFADRKEPRGGLRAIGGALVPLDDPRNSTAASLKQDAGRLSAVLGATISVVSDEDQAENHCHLVVGRRETTCPIGVDGAAPEMARLLREALSETPQDQLGGLTASDGFRRLGRDLAEDCDGLWLAGDAVRTHLKIAFPEPDEPLEGNIRADLIAEPCPEITS